jgi:hypothetical protein
LRKAGTSLAPREVSSFAAAGQGKNRDREITSLQQAVISRSPKFSQ